MKRFVRDIDLHGHHRDCDCAYPMSDLHGSSLVCALHEDWYGKRVCTCRELDEDDWYAAGDRAMDERRENPRERTEYDD